MKKLIENDSSQEILGSDRWLSRLQLHHLPKIFLFLIEKDAEFDFESKINRQVNYFAMLLISHILEWMSGYF